MVHLAQSLGQVETGSSDSSAHHGDYMHNIYIILHILVWPVNWQAWGPQMFKVPKFLTRLLSLRCTYNGHVLMENGRVLGKMGVAQ